MRSAEDRRAAHRHGIFAERAAIAVLRFQFYSILARRYRTHGGEIDIIARRGDTIAFVEVKARPTLDESREAISLAKRRRISRAARVWLAANPLAAGLNLRGDAIFIAPWRWPRHVPSAIELDMN